MSKALLVTAASLLAPVATLAATSDTGAASGRMLARPEASLNTIESMSSVQRVRIPVNLQGWNTLPTRTGSPGNLKQPRIAAKPLTHVLRARLERPNDFYLGDWRLQTTPVRWLKSSNQYQVRIEIFRRYGEAGQVEESLGSMNLSGVLQKQTDGLYLIQGSARRRFNDTHGLPVLEVEVGTPQIPTERAPMVSKAGFEK